MPYSQRAIRQQRQAWREAAVAAKFQALHGDVDELVGDSDFRSGFLMAYRQWMWQWGQLYGARAAKQDAEMANATLDTSPGAPSDKPKSSSGR